MKVARAQVYEAIDGEREYQNKKWNASTTTTAGQHNCEEFLMYIRDYTEEAIHFACRNPAPSAETFMLNGLRKIAALAVAAMEQNGVALREDEGARPYGFTQK